MQDDLWPTQPFRSLTLPMAGLGEPAGGNDPSWRCTRCMGLLEPLSQGHYRDTCTLVPRGGWHHFCCPYPTGCELRAGGALHGAPPQQP